MRKLIDDLLRHVRLCTDVIYCSGQIPNYDDAKKSTALVMKMYNGFLRNPDEPKKGDIVELKGNIEFRNVSFFYPSRPETKVCASLAWSYFFLGHDMTCDTDLGQLLSNHSCWTDCCPCWTVRQRCVLPSSPPLSVDVSLCVGKSTIVSLIQGLYPLAGGQVTPALTRGLGLTACPRSCLMATTSSLWRRQT